MFSMYHMRCFAWFGNNCTILKNVKNTHEACNFTKSNTLPWVFFTFFKIVQMIPNRAKHHVCLTNIICSSSSKRFLHKRVPVWITLYYILRIKTDTYWDITTDIFRLYSLKHQITFGLLQNSFKVVVVRNYMENIDLVRFLFCVIVLEKNMHYSFHRFYGR